MKNKFFSLKKITSKNSAEVNLIPVIRRDDDIFIVSFPRSGNTWVSFILANMIVEKLDLDLIVNFFNIHGFVPDIHQGRYIMEDLGFFPFKRMIKSHAAFHPEYKNVIYIIRDPKSVMVSYYKYLFGLKMYTKKLSDFIRDKNFGVNAWAAHVQSWLNRIKPGTRFRLFKYEGFQANSHENIVKMAELLGVNISDEQINRISHKCSFASMQDLENDSKSLSICREEKSINFIRKGKLDDWKNKLSKQDIDYINSVLANMKNNFGYL